MKKYYPVVLSLLIILISASASNGQYDLPQNKVWAMGYNSGLDFNSGAPVPMTTSIFAFEGCASVSSSTGNLLFYTNGTNVWDAAGNIMPNGNTLFPGPNNTYSTTQAALIVPYHVPGSNRYYVFSLASRLYCNVVDMNLNNGMGDVLTSFPLRNIPLMDSLTEKLIAIPGCNNNTWVLTRSNTQHKFMAFEITPAGLDTTPVVSYTGGLVAPFRYFQGYMKASPQGDRIVTTLQENIGQGALEYYKFDYTAGQVYDRKVIDSSSGYGVAFSPDGTKIYAQVINKVYQYDLNSLQPAQTKTYLGTAFLSELKLGPDGRIYFMSAYQGSEYNSDHYDFMGCIMQPDNSGLACGFRDSVQELHFLSRYTAPVNGLSLGLPNEVVLPGNRAVSPGRLMLDTFICKIPASGIYLKPLEGFLGYYWSDGYNGADRTVMQHGTYIVHYGTPCGKRSDTFRIRGTGEQATLTYNSPVISVSGNFQSYQWYKESNLLPGATGSSLTATAEGWYSVVVTDTGNCSDSVSIQIKSSGGNTAIHDPSLSGQIMVYPNPATRFLNINSPVPVVLSLRDIAGKVVLSATADRLDISTLSNGIYILKIMDKNGLLLKTEKVVRQKDEL